MRAADHRLGGTILSEYFDMLMTAIRYNQMYNIIISMINLTILNGGKLADSIILKINGYIFVLGTLLFSFGIYTSILFDISQALRLARIGRTTLLIGWLGLVVVGVLNKKSSI